MKILKLSDEDYETLKKVLCIAEHDRAMQLLTSITNNHVTAPSSSLQNVQRMNALFQEVEYENA